MTLTKTLQLRQIASDFQLVDQHEQPFVLSDAWGQAHTVLCFIARPYDPATQQFGGYIARMADGFANNNARLAFIVQGDIADADIFSQAIHFNGPALADPDFTVYEQYKLHKAFNPTARSGFVVISQGGMVTYIRSLMDFWGWRQESRLLSEHVRGLSLSF